MTLGKIINNYRSENKMSMDEFSIRSGISKATISILENNRNPQTGKKPTPTIDTIRKVALAIGCDIDEIFSKLDKDSIINIPIPIWESVNLTRNYLLIFIVSAIKVSVLFSTS